MGRPKLELPAKQCANCKAMFERRDGEDAPNYRRRKTCCMRCRDELLSSINPRRLVIPEHRTCPECGTEFTRAPDEKPAEFMKRATCSRTCGIIYAGKNRTKYSRETSKTCRNCGTAFYREPGISPAAFARRRVCSPECHQASLRLPTAPSDLERSCVVCGSKLEQRRNESTREFLTRTTCGGPCRHRLANKPSKLIDYYGATLSIADVVEIEGKSKETVSRAINSCKLPGVRWIEVAAARPKVTYSGPLIKTCEVCGRPFAYTTKNRLHFETQTACSNACAALRRRSQEAPHENCAACGKPLFQRPKEQYYAFLKRDTCGRACTLKKKAQFAETVATGAVSDDNLGS